MSSIIFQRSGVIDVSSFERTSRESFPALKGILLIDAPRETRSNYGEAVQLTTLFAVSAASVAGGRAFAILTSMTKLLSEVMRQITELPEKRQVQRESF